MFNKFNLSALLAVLSVFLTVLNEVVATGPAAVNLRTAANYAILAETGVSTVPNSAVVGDIGLSPAAATYLTGWSLTIVPPGAYSMSTQCVGKIYAADYATPTPSILSTAIGDMSTAATDAAGRTSPDYLNLGAGAISGTLSPGLYSWTTAVTIPGNVIISGSSTDTWIFQVASTLTMANAKSITLSGGALHSNIWWVVAGAVVVGTGSHFEGVILGVTSIAFQTGSSINGRLLAQTAVTLDTTTVTP